MASGHVNRTNRPNTWLHRPALDVKTVLANSEPSTHGMERLHVDGRLRAAVAAARTEHIGCPFLELCFPRRDLIGVDVKLLASSATVRSPLMAASATLALKPGVWFRRGRLLIVSPNSPGTACPLSGRNSTYRLVQIGPLGGRGVPPGRDRSASLTA